MEQALRNEPGKLSELLSSPEDWWEALEADLLRRGVVMGDLPHRVGWRAVISMARSSTRDDALGRLVGGDAVRWTDADYMLASIVDLTRINIWFQTADGQNNRRRPEPLPRPGDVPASTQIGNAAMTVDETVAWLDELQNNPRTLKQTGTVSDE